MLAADGPTALPTVLPTAVPTTQSPTAFPTSEAPTASPTKAGHSIVESACWYLDFDWDIDRYLGSDTILSLLDSNEVFKRPPYMPSVSSTKLAHDVLNNTMDNSTAAAPIAIDPQSPPPYAAPLPIAIAFCAW